MIMNAKRRRPEFQLLTGIEYLVSAGAIGATGMFSSLSGIAPRLVRRLYDICRQENYFEARKPQEEISVLHQVIKGAGFAGLKGAMRAMGRDCGEPRRPVIALGTSYEKLAAEINALAILREEPRGW
jgi:dihydrodipicolinate synthase/N-acetylneuraminate lyase